MAAGNRQPLLRLALLCALAAIPGVGSRPLAAQAPAPVPGKEEDEIGKAGRKDPLTQAEPAAMAALGVVGYGPMPWVDGKSTADVDRVLGENRILWLETAHFRIGSSLKSAPIPEEPDEKKDQLDELQRLHKRSARVPERPRRLDPWLRLHLYAQRCEAAYADFQKLLGIADDPKCTGKVPRQGRYLGLPDKFPVLLLQKKSDLARYLDRFCGRQGDRSFRFYHDKSAQMAFAAAVEGLENVDEPGFHCHVVYSVFLNLLNGYQGYYYELPPWLAEGLAHWYSRRVTTKFVNVVAKPGEALDEEKQHEWARKVRARAAYERGTLPFATMAAWKSEAEMGYQDHIQSWSRVDYLMAQGPAKVGLLVQRLKNLPLPADNSGVPLATVQAACGKQLQEIFGLDAAAFDARCRDWVLQTYPKK